MMKLFVVSSLFAIGAFAAEFKGTISDAKCAAAHADASEKSIKCVTACVNKGGAPVLVSDGKVLQIADESKSKVMEHLGHKVTVTGKMEGEKLVIEKVSM